ncbi:hypothetical protein EG850_10925 [Gulosibacter macacae]|uniref:Chitin-binding type-3 domain-containing protein n=1 Tax=Gulosibacter macacae TaxID=2488791 RepID=A0A3P3VTW6_9MICO|nr:hypothetical protein [Gulosibacter macacae]RRJ85894.1 hypothetical protein EG850_10925 [Gulosibacter macacae]
MTIPEIDFESLTAEELADLIDRANIESIRRAAVKDAEQRVIDIQIEVLTASGREMGAPWVAPSGAHDAYPQGWTVAYGGKTWESLVAGNAHPPGVSGWREVAPAGAVPEWVQPVGGHDAYKVGDVVTRGGKTWRSTADANVWPPGVYGWVET